MPRPLLKRLSRCALTPTLALALALSSTLLHKAQAQSPATPSLTTEAVLQTPAGAEAIAQFWSRTGQAGSFTGQGGLTLVFRSFLQPDLATEKGAIVIASGRTESMLKYKETIHDLYRNGWSVYIHDHRGQGLSDRERVVAQSPQKGHVLRFQDFADDLRTFIATQIPAERHKNLVLMAHSMGGAISSLFLEGGGPEVQRLRAAALSSPMLRIKGAAGAPADIVSCKVAKAEVKLGRATDYVVTGKGWQNKPFKSDNIYTSSEVRFNRVAAEEVAEPKVQLGSPTHGWMDQACEGAFRARNNGAKVNTPLLLVMAGKDAIVHNSGAVEFCRGVKKSAPASGCNGPDGGPFVVEGGQHELFIERDELRNAALTRVLGFFDSQRR